MRRTLSTLLLLSVLIIMTSPVQAQPDPEQRIQQIIHTLKTKFDTIELSQKQWFIIRGTNTAISADVAKNAQRAHFPLHVYDYFDPTKNETDDFVIWTTFDLNDQQYNYTRPLALFFPHIGQNWRVFLNGDLLHDEMYPDKETGGIDIYRSAHGVIVPISHQDLQKKNNTLVIQLRGITPALDYLGNSEFGLKESTGYTLGSVAKARLNDMEILWLNLNGIGLIFGVIYLLIFARNRNSLSSLFFGLLCIMISIRSTLLSQYIYSIIEDSSIITRLDLISTYALPPLLIAFLNEFFFKKNKMFVVAVSLPTVPFCLSAAFAPYRYVDVFFALWQVMTLVALSYLALLLVKMVRENSEQVFSFTAFMIASLLCSIWDLLDSMFFFTGISLLELSFFAVMLKIAHMLYQRFMDMHDETLLLNEHLEKQKNAFYRFVPDTFLRLLNRNSATDIELGDNARRSMSVLFADIKSFSLMSESMTPEETFTFLNEYLEIMEPVIRSHGGFVDKYIGDAILALFNDEDDKAPSAERALRCAIEMQMKLPEINNTRSSSNQPPVSIRIGVNSGDLMLGTVGSQNRIDTTVIGNTVNLASRLEGLNTFYHSGIIISDHTFRQLPEPENFCYREIDSVQVKGKKEPVVIYEIFDIDDEQTLELKRSTIPHITLGLIHYKARDFREAWRNFSRAYKEFPEDRLAKIYCLRCKRFMETPPPDDWNGVFKFNNKFSG